MLGRRSKDENAGGSTTSSRARETAKSALSVISEEMTIRGDCVVDGRLRIEGRIHGSVRAGGLELAPTGSVQGDLVAAEGANGVPFKISGKVDGEVKAAQVEVAPTGSVLKGIRAESAHVRGSVEGGILARRRLILDETAVVEGDVRAHSLVLKEGGRVNGSIVMGEGASAEPASEDEAADGAGGETVSGEVDGEREAAHGEEEADVGDEQAAAGEEEADRGERTKRTVSQASA